MFLEYSGNFLFYFLSPAGSESAVAQPVIAVQAEGDLEVLEFIENEEADNIAGLFILFFSNRKFFPRRI